MQLRCNLDANLMNLDATQMNLDAIQMQLRCNLDELRYKMQLRYKLDATEMQFLGAIYINFDATQM